MQYQYNANVSVGDYNVIFPRQVQPPIVYDDYLAAITPASYTDNSSLKTDTIFNCLTAQPLFVPHNNQITQSGLTVVDQDQHLLQNAPAVAWTTVSLTNGNNISIQNFREPNLGYQYVDCQVMTSTPTNESVFAICDSMSNAFPANFVPLNAQSIVFILTRANFYATPTIASSYYTFTVEVSNGTSPNLYYQIYVSNNTYPRILFAKGSMQTFTPIKEQFRTDGGIYQYIGNTDVDNNASGLFIEVSVLNGAICINFGSQTSPYVATLPDKSYYNATITTVGFYATQFTHCGFSLHPIKYAASGTFTSGMHQLGFAPDPSTPPYYFIQTGKMQQKALSGQGISSDFPNTTTLKVTTYPNTGTTPVPQYTFDMDNVVAGSYAGEYYSDLTAVVTHIATVVDPIIAAPSGAGVSLPCGTGWNTPVKEINENIAFDPSSLTIRHTASIVMNNFEGLSALESITGITGSGNISVGIQMGYESSPLFDRFYGICETYTFDRPTSNIATCTLHCEDQMRVLANSYIFAPPNMDGWNHYYAIAYLAQYAGISLTQMAFAALVPSDPYSYVQAGSGGGVTDPDPYFLPIGIGLNPWTPINRNLSVLELMDFIRKATGYITYFGTDGMFYYQPWLPSTANPTPKRIFTEVSGMDSSGMPTDIWNLSVISSTSDVRNKVVLIGMDMYDPLMPNIVISNEDSASIYSPPGSQPMNYKGYRAPFVLADSRFADYNFAQTSANNIYYFTRIPLYQVQFTTWLQPDLNPLDVIQVNDSKTGIGAYPLTIMSISNTLSVMNNLVQSSTITARYLPPIASAPAPTSP